MNAMAAATDEQVSMLDSLVSSLQSVEQTLAGVLAARDGLLALAGKLALSMAEDGDGIDASDLTIRTVAAEVGAVLRLSDRTVQRRMGDASITVEGFPLVWAAQGTGRISAGHARVIVDAGLHLDDAEARNAYSARVLEFAEEESPNRLRPIAARIAEQYQPRSLEERHADAREKRTLWVKDAADGMAELGILGPAVLVHAAFDRLTSMAKADSGSSVEGEVSAGGAGAAFGLALTSEAADLRTLSHKRSDLAFDLLLTGAPAGHDTPDGMLAAITPHVGVTVPVTTLMNADGVDTPPAELNGRIPIDIDSARVLAGAASGWDRILTHPISGDLLAVDRYRPSAHLRRQLQARDQRCRFVGCGMPAGDSDLDHTLDAALGGPTEEDNLADLCRRHHVLKHHSPWHVTQLGGGLLEWLSPTGRVYIDKPPPQNAVTFSESPPIPGFSESPPIPGFSQSPPVPGDRIDPAPGESPDVDSTQSAGVDSTEGADRGSTESADAWASAPEELLAPF